VIPLQMLLACVLGWLEAEQRDVIALLREENRVLKAQLGRRRLRLDNDQRRRLAVLGQRLGRALMHEVATLLTPDTILRWHRELSARKWTYARQRPGRPGVLREIRRLVIRMATENPRWGYTRIQGALKNVGHQVARSTIAAILKAEGIPPSGKRPSPWRTSSTSKCSITSGAVIPRSARSVRPGSSARQQRSVTSGASAAPSSRPRA
jgi:putative transposase